MKLKIKKETGNTKHNEMHKSNQKTNLMCEGNVALHTKIHISD